MLNVGCFDVDILGWVLMLGLMIYAAFVLTGLVVVSIVLAHLIIQVIKSHKRQQKRDASLIDLPSGTVGDIAG